ncbi:hypothetical protein A2U01_0109378, partial [Trifolium medium]|nr:hypothetical protein [Trifolium medium]
MIVLSRNCRGLDGRTIGGVAVNLLLWLPGTESTQTSMGSTEG